MKATPPRGHAREAFAQDGRGAVRDLGAALHGVSLRARHRVCPMPLAPRQFSG